MLAKSGYKKNAEYREYREMTLDEVKSLHGSHASVLDRFGDVRTVKVTSVKTWKRRPNDVEIHWKYGLYEYGTTDYVNGVHSNGPRFVVEVSK